MSVSRGFCRLAKQRKKRVPGGELWKIEELPIDCLAAEAEALDDFLVFVEVVLLDVVEELTATIGHGDEATTAVEILAMGAQVFGEVGNALGEERDLHFSRSRVLVVDAEIVDDGCFIELGFLCHDLSFSVFTIEGQPPWPSVFPAEAEKTVSVHLLSGPIAERSSAGRHPFLNAKRRKFEIKRRAGKRNMTQARRWSEFRETGDGWLCLTGDGGRLLVNGCEPIANVPRQVALSVPVPCPLNADSSLAGVGFPASFGGGLPWGAAFEGFDLVAQEGCPLKLELAGGFEHFFLQFGQDCGYFLVTAAFRH